MDKSIFKYATLKSPLGTMLACASDKGICILEFMNDDLDKKLETIRKKLNGLLERNETDILTQLKVELKKYFSGKSKDFSVPLDFRGTDFQKTVWTELQKIPYGATRTYTQQSKALGNLKAIRAVASANSKNKIALIVPCHRVIGEDGSLTGYAGGLAKKRWLLDHERKHSGKAIQGEIAF